MISRQAKPHLLLLDANIIIEAHELNVWSLLVDSYRLTIPSVIARHEAKYFFVSGHYNPINLNSDLGQKKIVELQAELTEIALLMKQFDALFAESIDPGEQEALALLLAERCPGHLFCSGDARSLQALAMLDMSDRGISLEELLNRIGQSRKLDDHFTRAFLDRQIAEGQRRRIQGDGLSTNSKFRI